VEDRDRPPSFSSEGRVLVHAARPGAGEGFALPAKDRHGCLCPVTTQKSATACQLT